MAIKLINQEFCPYSKETKKEFLCDSDADFAKLPVACTGSTAVSIATGNVRIVNTSGEWVAFGG
jgi:hypothetical protein